MKHILALLLLCVSLSLSSQTIIQQTSNQNQWDFSHLPLYQNNDKSFNDTVLKDDFFSMGYPQSSLHPNNGYVMGCNWNATNDRGPAVVAQGYQMQQYYTYDVEGVMVWVNKLGQTSSSSTPSLKISMYLVDGSTSYTVGGVNHIIARPRTPLNSKVIQFDSIIYFDSSFYGSYIPKISEYTIAMFDESTYIDEDYAILLDYTNFYTNNDTISFFSSAQGGGSMLYGTDMLWELYWTGTANIWVLMEDVWNIGSEPLDGCLAAFPIVHVYGANLDEKMFIDGMKLHNYPNPADNNTCICYDIEKDGNVVIEIINSRGQQIKTINQNNVSAGKHEINISISELPAGLYYYSIIHNNERLTQKLIIE